MSHRLSVRRPLQYGSVCSGIEAVSLAWRPLGLQPAWFAEIDPFPNAVLSHHYPSIPNLGDMTAIARQVRAGRVPAPDILVGGTPCQSFSTAGLRQGLNDPRGALTLSYVEVANAIDKVRLKTNLPPTAIVWENVPGVLSDRGNAFGAFLGALAGERCPLEPAGKAWTHAGCVSGPRRRVAWRVLDAQHFGLAQRRRRVFLVASGGDHFDPAEVLFESPGVPGDPASGQAPWEDAPAAPTARPIGAGFAEVLKSPYGKVNITFGYGGGNTRGPIDVAACLTAAGFRCDFDVETFLVQSIKGNIAHTLSTANGGKGCSEDGTGKGVPIIATYHTPAYSFAENSRGELRYESGHGQVTGALSAGGGKAGQGQPTIAYPVPQDCNIGLPFALGTEVSPALRTCSHAGNMGHVLEQTFEAHYRCTPEHQTGQAWPNWRVRRLTPRECERLQGMPDDYTHVPYRGGLAADAPRYKAIGNSKAVPCVPWLGHRLLSALDQSGKRRRPVSH